MNNPGMDQYIEFPNKFEGSTSIIDLIMNMI